jgi:hypothetical protein
MAGEGPPSTPCGAKTEVPPQQMPPGCSGITSAEAKTANTLQNLRGFLRALRVKNSPYAPPTPKRPTIPTSKPLTTRHKYVLHTFMPPQPQRPALNNGPSPNQAGPEPQSTPTRSARLRTLLQTLIAFASSLVETLATNQTADPAIAYRFGTSNLSLITARIARALLMAMALNRRLTRIAKQLDAPQRPTTTAKTRREPRAPKPPTPRRSETDDEALLTRLPTAQEIAAQIRHRPIGRVLEDICRDLGILPSDPLWRDLQLPIIANGGNLVRLFKHVTTRVIRHSLNPTPLLAATGPP